MSWTRLSFIYLAGYLWIGGLGLLAAPDRAIRLLGSDELYPPVLLRLAGGLMLALGIVVADIARQRIEPLYPTTLIVRTVLLATILWLFIASRDVLFLSLAGIVAFGMLLTGLGLVADRRGPADVA
jgi:uncharacterized protein YjeT (DUF2065 family)